MSVKFTEFCLDLLFPLSCLLCKQTCPHPLSLCSSCQKLISKQTEPLETNLFVPSYEKHSYWHNIRYLSLYQTPIKELIYLGKFENNLSALKLLGQLFAQHLIKRNYETDLVLIPVPLHQNRLIERGFNQALEIALPIAKSLNLEINNHCVFRKIEAQTQHLLTRQQRIDNTQNIFQVMSSVPKKVAVIDDVFTTGATMRSICSCLQNAGAEIIEVWIIARTLKPSSGILTDNKNLY